MTTVTVTGTVTSYALKSPVTYLGITAQGYVDGGGVAGGKSGAYTIVNDGRITGGFAVYLQEGGVLTNGSQTDQSALVEASLYGVFIEHTTGVVTNYGTIISTADQPGLNSAAVIVDSGAVTNGGPLDSAARIEGKTGVEAYTLANFGTIQGFLTGASNVEVVTNGAATQTGALIEGGGSGVYTQSALTMTNFGAVEGVLGLGVGALDGGSLANGAVTDEAALIEGYDGVFANRKALAVKNFATIIGSGQASNNAGVYLEQGGVVTNGGGGDRSALVQGYDGVRVLGGAGTVTNFGAVAGLGEGGRAAGVYLEQGGVVTNGGPNDRSALISGDEGVLAQNAPAYVANFATIAAVGRYGDFAVVMYSGGSMTNGAVSDPTALLTGYGGFFGYGTGSSTNFGAIQATGGPDFGIGVLLAGGADFANGAADDTHALIEGYVGAALLKGDTLTNFGTIVGVGGKAVTFSNHGELVVEAGSAFIGAVDGDGGILDLASGTGTIVLAGHVETVSGSMAATTFSKFDTVKIPTGASFKVSGNNTGLLEVLGGTLTSDGTVSGTGRLDIDRGVADFGAGFEEAVDFTGTTGELKLGSSKTYAGEITGFSKTGTTSLDLLDIAFAGTTTAAFAGTATSGVLTVTEGSNTAKITLEGDYLSSTFTLSAAPGGGTLVVDPARPTAPASDPAGSDPAHRFVDAMAGLTAQAGVMTSAADNWPTPAASTLARPRAQID